MRPLSLWIPAGILTALFWTLLALCLVAQALIVRGLFRATVPTVAPDAASPAAGAAPPSPASGVPAPHRWAEVAWAVLPIVGLLLAFLGAWRLLP